MSLITQGVFTSRWARTDVFVKSIFSPISQGEKTWTRAKSDLKIWTLNQVLKKIRIKSTHVWGLVHRRRRWGIPCSYLLCAWWRLRLWPPAAAGRAAEKRPSAAVAAEAGPGAAAGAEAGAALRLWRRSTGWPSTPHHQLRCRCEHTQERPVAAERQREPRGCAPGWNTERQSGGADELTCLAGVRWKPDARRWPTLCATIAHPLAFLFSPRLNEWASACERATTSVLCVLARSESDSKRLYPLRRPVLRRLKWSAVWSFCCCCFSQGPHL